MSAPRHRIHTRRRQEAVHDHLHAAILVAHHARRPEPRDGASWAQGCSVQAHGARAVSPALQGRRRRRADVRDNGGEEAKSAEGDGAD